MKILIIMQGFFPGKKYGGPPVSVDNFCSLMQEEHDCYIVTCNHDMGENNVYSGIVDGWNQRSNCKVLYLSDKQYNNLQFMKIIDEIEPNLIYLQGLFQTCILPCLKIAKKRKIKVLLAPRGELCNGAISQKKYKKVPYIVILRLLGYLEKVRFQSTSIEESLNIKKYLGVKENYIHFLTNIPSIPSEEYSYEYKEKGSAKFIFLSRIHPKKNLLFALECLVKCRGKITFDIYGPKEDILYWQECQTVINKLPSNITVNYCGLVSHDCVHRIFSKYDLFIFPTLSENYGHVIAEALISGCPVLISDQTPWHELEKNNVGWDIALEKEQFIQKLQMIISIDENDMKRMRIDSKKFIIEKSKLERVKQEYIKIINILQE